MEHEIIWDLLPLYHDGVCSEKSRAAVEEHLKDCPACRAALAAMDAPLPDAQPPVPDEEAAVKGLSQTWEKSKRRAWWKGALIAAAVCGLLAVGGWALNNWTILPVDGSEYTVRASRLENGMISVHWQTNRAGWYAVTWREDEDGVHWYLERPLLRTTVFNFNNKQYRSSGDILFSGGDAMDTSALYFGLGEDALLLWQEGETVDLPAATSAEEEQWAPAMEEPQELS